MGSRESKYKSLLRFTTAGSVDDGKSTLIGRLLYDSKSIFEDQRTYRTVGETTGREELPSSLLTDGLRAEREQGYHYWCRLQLLPHLQENSLLRHPRTYTDTRNMVTGASTADLPLYLLMHGKGYWTDFKTFYNCIFAWYTTWYFLNQQDGYGKLVWDSSSIR